MLNSNVESAYDRLSFALSAFVRGEQWNQGLGKPESKPLLTGGVVVDLVRRFRQADCAEANSKRVFAGDGALGGADFIHEKKG
jgi:hypothetical protein